MKLNELEKIVEQLKRYELLSETFDIKGWITNLNEKQIKNFIDLDIELNGYLKNNRGILMNYSLLNSIHYIYDLNLINTSDDKSAEYIITLIKKNPDHLSKSYHRKDIKIIRSISDEVTKMRFLNLALYDNRTDDEHIKYVDSIFMITKEGNNLRELKLIKNEMYKYTDGDKEKDIDLKKVLK